jgi:hypothetical protein
MWTWEAGSNVTNQRGVYGHGGNAFPGGRYGAVAWAKDGKFHLFGGRGYGAGEGLPTGELNDLW